MEESGYPVIHQELVLGHPVGDEGGVSGVEEHLREPDRDRARAKKSAIPKPKPYRKPSLIIDFSVSAWRLSSGMIFVNSSIKGAKTVTRMT